MRDIGGSLWGTAVFSLAMVAPGYCVARALNFSGFRLRGFCEQLAWSLVLSAGVGTICLVALVGLAGVTVAGLALVATGAIAAVLFWRRKPAWDFSQRDVVICSAVALAWVGIAILSLVDLAHGPALWMSVTSFDHCVRVAFVGGVMRTGVVPANPLYWPGYAAPMHYYYFWYVTCAVVGKLAHISPRQAFIASCVWPPFVVAALLALFGRYLMRWRGAQLRRAWKLTLLLMAVTGLDLLVVLLARSAGGALAGDLEWWSIDQVTSWADTFLWVPHHAIALVCVMLAALLLWMGSRESEGSSRGKMGALAGVSFASAFGLSAYVAVAGALVLGLWLVWRLFCSDRSRAAATTLIAACVAAIVLSPYLAQMLHHGAGESSGATHVLGFGVRRMFPSEMLAGIPSIQALSHVHRYRAMEVSALLLLIPGYVAELGFFAVVLVAALWRRQRSSGEAAILFWACAGLLFATFIRSRVIATNDYSVRASLIPQFCLLLLGAVVWMSASRRRRFWLGAFALIGLVGSVYQVAMLRFYLPWHEAHGDSLVAELSERNYALRDAYATLDVRVPANARVQYNNVPGGYFLFAQMIDANRQLLAGDYGCDTTFGGDPGPCFAIQHAISAFYQENGSSKSLTAAEARGLCGNVGAQYLVATRWDKPWNDTAGWVWHLPAVVVSPEVRIVACADAASVD